MEQAKKRDHKIMITDIAIDKTSKVNIPYYSDEQNNVINQTHRELLKIAKNDNNSNEVAYLINMSTFDKSYQLGEENHVNVFSNPYGYGMANRSGDRELFLAHNHPSTKDFSYSDIGVFIHYDCVGAMSVVTNTGEVHIIYKTDKYDYKAAYSFMRNLRSQYNEYNEYIDKELVKSFLKAANSLGIKEY